MTKPDAATIAYANSTSLRNIPCTEDYYLCVERLAKSEGLSFDAALSEYAKRWPAERIEQIAAIRPLMVG